MAKISLENIISGFNLQKINNNFQKIQAALQNQVYYRDNPLGEPNALLTNLDANGRAIYNLPAPSVPSQAARLQDIQNAIGRQATANLTAFSPTSNISATNVQGAIEELDSELRNQYADSLGATRVGYGTTTVASQLDLLYYGVANVRDKKYAGGAKADGVSDDWAAIQAAVTDAEINKKTVLIPGAPNSYRISAPIVKSPSFTVPNIIGDGAWCSILEFTGNQGNRGMLEILGGSGSLANSVISGIGFKATNTMFGIEVISQCGVLIENCKFYSGRVAVLLANTNLGFTEFIVLRGCVVEQDCEQALVYTRDGGTDSFHGSGMSWDCVINERVGATRSPIEIGGELSASQNIYVYDAPMCPKWFKVTAGIPFIKNNSTRPAQNFYGHLRFEDFSNADFQIVSTASGGMVYYIGTVAELTSRATAGNLRFCDSFATNVNGVFIGHLLPYKEPNKAIVTGANTLATLTAVVGEMYEVTIAMSASNIQYQNILKFTTAQIGTSGFVSPVVNVGGFFTGNLPAPTFTLTSDSKLIMTCTDGANSWNTAGVTAVVSVNQNGFGFTGKF